MKKIIIAAVVLAVCFTLTASGQSVLTLHPTGIDQEANTGDVVIYTSRFGDTILAGEVNDDHGFKNFYVLSIVPRINEELSESEIESSSVSDVASEEISEIVSEPLESYESSSVLPDFGSSTENGTSDGVTTASAADYKYKIEAVYAPGDSDKDVTIPENGFVIAFEVSEEESETANINKGDLVAIYGINLEEGSVNDGAYVEIDLSQRDLMGDIPETADKSKIAFFAILGVTSTFAAFAFYNRRFKSI